MSAIEEMIRRHSLSVDNTLKGFEGKISSIDDLVKVLSAEVKTIGDRPIPSASRRFGGPAGDEPPASSKSAAPSTVGRLSIPAAERDELSAILRGDSMKIASEPDGGYLVPEVTRAEIEALVLAQSPIRRVAKVVDFTSGSTTIPVNTRGTTGGWVAEDEERIETGTPGLEGIRPPGGTLYALPSATEELIDDAIVNLEAFIEENVIDTLASLESQAFISGDGMNKPLGFLSPAMPAPSSAADDIRTRGTLQYVPSGQAAALPAASDDMLAMLVAMIFALKAGYRQAPGAAWLASTAMIAGLAKITTTDGAPVYIPGLASGLPGMLLGYPVVEAEHMATIAANTFPLAFGNWKRGYVVGDRTPLNVLRDPYTRKGRVLWYFRKRVHGSVLNHEAIKLLKVAVA